MSAFDVVGPSPTWLFLASSREWHHKSGDAVIRPTDKDHVRMFEWTVIHDGNEHYSTSLTLSEAQERAEVMLTTYRQLDEIKEML